MEEEVSSTFRCAEVLRGLGHDVPDTDRELLHMVSSAMFSGIFEIVVHDMDKTDARYRVRQLKEFFTGGWSRLMKFDFQ